MCRKPRRKSNPPAHSSGRDDKSQKLCYDPWRGRPEP